MENPCIAAHDLLGVDLAPIQRLVFNDMWFKDYVIITAARGFGKSYLLGLLASLSSLLRPGYRVGLIGPAFRQCFFSDLDCVPIFTDRGLISDPKEFYDSIKRDTTIQSLHNTNPIKNKWLNNKQEGLIVKTEKGFEIGGLNDHKVLTLDENLDLVYKNLKDLTTEDHLVIRKGFNLFGNNTSLCLHEYSEACGSPKDLTQNLAYFMGLCFGSSSIPNKRIDSFCSIDIADLSDKKIPSVINKAPKEFVCSFLSGLMDSDGDVKVRKNKAEVFLFSSSRMLAKQVQAWFLNLGIISSIEQDKEFQDYRVIISDAPSLFVFKDSVGFRPGRKKDVLDKYLSNLHNSRNKNSIIIPNSNSVVKRLVSCCSKETKIKIGKFLKSFEESIKDFSKREIVQLLDHITGHDIELKDYKRLKEIVDLDLFFVRPLEFEKHEAETIDIEVENEHCYWAGGFINHNSKMIFAEVEKLFVQSSIFREACEKPPIRGTDSCYLKFKSVAGMSPSYIEAIPLGNDGAKIRGSRFYLIVVDELAQVPDQILDLVIRPFGATSLAPMERVRRLEQQQKLISLGLASEEDFEKETVNKMVMTSSGYYKFNHMWRRMKDHWRQIYQAAIRNEESPYAVWQVPYWDLPTGFLDMNNINEAKRVMSSSEFRMEYEAAMISDSEGFFKASLLEQCTLNSGHTIELRGDSSAQYILGVDPNQGGKASTGIVVIKLGQVSRVVGVLELKNKTTQDLTKNVQELCDKFKVIRVFIDKGGGGKAIIDLLEEGYGGSEPIIDRTNEDHKHLEGRHILEPINFNPSWISDANFTTKAMLEDKKLLFPEVPINSTIDLESLQYESVKTLKSQMLNIIVTQTATGVLHFDTPSKGQNKDLYSALILAAQGVREIEKELEGVQEPILYNVGGFIRPRQAGATFNALEHANSSENSKRFISAAVLQKKK
jgi:intein/homing endonuclease